MIEVEPGGEYPGETYIKCTCGEQFDSRVTRPEDSLAELESWINEHRSH
jgi:hypothetical protein